LSLNNFTLYALQSTRKNDNYYRLFLSPDIKLCRHFL
jgi:hypothetical protein